MSYYATDGRALFVARMRADEKTVVILREDGRSYETPVSDVSLFDPRIAVHPQAGIAVVARSASDYVFGCMVGDGTWVSLGPSAQPCGVRFNGVVARAAWVDPRGAVVYEANMDGGGLLVVQRVHTSQGILEWSEIRHAWDIASNSEITTVHGIGLIKAVYRGGWWLGQHVLPTEDRLLLVRHSDGYAFKAGPQAERPNLVVIGDRLIVNGGKEFRPPYPPKDRVEAPAPQPTPLPPTPVPPKEKPTVLSRLDLLEKWRAFYSHEQPGVRRGFLISNGYAWDRRAEGFGLLDKRNPTGSTYAYDGKHFPGDIVVLPNGDHFDVLQDGDGVATPTFQAKGKIRDGWRWVPPYDPAVFGTALPVPPPAPQPNPEPTPPQPPPTVDLSAVLHRLDALTTAVNTLGAVTVGLANGMLDIRAQQDRPYEGRVFGARVTLTPKEAPPA